jgi:transcriptional regulator with XRE-family HTH domain
MSPDRPPHCTLAVNRTYLSKLEKGASYPGLEIIAKLAIVPEVELRDRIEAELADETRGAAEKWWLRKRSAVAAPTAHPANLR